MILIKRSFAYIWQMSVLLYFLWYTKNDNIALKDVMQMKKTYDDFVISAAKECAANLKPEEIEYIKTNISYSSHHFLYGMAPKTNPSF